MKLPLYVVDAFVDGPFSGNPAAVVPMDAWLPDSTMQLIAAQNNLSETAFFLSAPQSGRFHMRWFSPKREIPFCGHATLAASQIIVDSLGLNDTFTVFGSAIGAVAIRKLGDGALEFEVPQVPLQRVTRPPKGLVDGLGIVPDEIYYCAQAYICVVQSETVVNSISPDYLSLLKLAPHDVCVTAAGNHVDFVSRYFWPANGGEEDPATGSIHAALAPLWAARLSLNQLRAEQHSRRRGYLRCEIRNEAQVAISGLTRTYLHGRIEV